MEDISTIAALCAAVDQERKANRNLLDFKVYIEYLKSELDKLPPPDLTAPPHKVAPVRRKQP